MAKPPIKLDPWPIADNIRRHVSPIPWHRANPDLITVDKLSSCQNSDLARLMDNSIFSVLSQDVKQFVWSRLGYRDAEQSKDDRELTESDMALAVKICRKVLTGEIEVSPEEQLKVALRFLDKKYPNVKPKESGKENEERVFHVNTGVPDAGG